MSTKFYTPDCYTGKMLFAVEDNASKIIRNWYFTIQPDILKLFTIYQSGQNKGHGSKHSFFGRFAILLLMVLGGWVCNLTSF